MSQLTGRAILDDLTSPFDNGRPNPSEMQERTHWQNSNSGRVGAMCRSILARYHGQNRDFVQDLPSEERSGATTLVLSGNDLIVQRILAPRTVRLLACYEGTHFRISNESGGNVPVQAFDGTAGTLALRTLIDGEAATFIRKDGFSSGAIPKWTLFDTNRPTESEVQGLATDLSTLSSAITSEASSRAAADTSEAAARAAADTSEATARAAADTTLTNSITSEATTRAAADTSEATARAAADTSEATTRAAADTTLNTAITAETTARGTAVTAEASARAAADTAIIAGNVATATKLQTPRNINGVAFDGSADITVTAAGSTLSDTVPIAKGGTGQTTAYAAADALSVHGADIASAATLDLSTATGNVVDVTGTVTITAITLGNGVERLVRFTGILTLTHGTNLVLPGQANITTRAGDIARFVGYAGSVVRCANYSPLVGLARADESYLVIAASTPLANERVATSGIHVSITDAGAGGAATFEWRFNARRRITFYSDFNTLGAFATSTSGTGTAAVLTGAYGDDNHSGFLELSLGTTTSGRAGIVMNDNTQCFQFGVNPNQSQACVKLGTLSDGTDTYTAWTGYNDTATGNGVDMVAFRYTHGTNSGRWEAVCRSNSSETATDTGIAAETSSFHTFEIFINAAGNSVTFYIDGSLVATVTTNIPTGSARTLGWLTGGVKSAGTTNRKIVSDMLNIEVDVSR